MAHSGSQKAVAAETNDLEMNTEDRKTMGKRFLSPVSSDAQDPVAKRPEMPGTSSMDNAVRPNSVASPFKAEQNVTTVDTVESAPTLSAIERMMQNLLRESETNQKKAMTEIVQDTITKELKPLQEEIAAEQEQEH